MAMAEIYGELGQEVLAGKHRALTEEIALDLLARAEEHTQRGRHQGSQESAGLALEITTVDRTRLRAHSQLIENYSVLGDDVSLAMQKIRAEETIAVIFQEGMAAKNDGRPQQAAESLALSFEFSQDIDIKIQAHAALLRIFEELGPSQLSQDHLTTSLRDANELADIGKDERRSGQLQQSADTFELSLKLSADADFRREVHAGLVEIYTLLGQTESAEQHRIQARN